MLREKRGITLIALVITIIVLLILAGVTISTILGDDGIISKAKNAQVKTEDAKLEEELNLVLANLKIDMATDGDMTALDDLLRGIYRYEISFGNGTPRGKVDGIFETSSGLSRATLVMNIDSDGGPSYKFENVKAVSEVPDMAMPIYLIMIDPDSTEIEEVDYNDYESYSIIGVKYKNVVYDVCDSESNNGFSLTISVREDFASKTWKNVFASDACAYALDSNDKLWVIYDETSGMCLNNMYPEFNDFVVKDAIYSYEYSDKNILGFIGTNGKIYILNNTEMNVNVEEPTDLIICLNDEFSSELGGIKAEEVIPSTEMYGIIQVESLFLGTSYFNCVIRDVDGKIWIVEFDYDNGDLIPHAICINDEISELSNIKFKQMVVCDTECSEDSFIESVALATYFTILGLDSNNQLWKIQNTDWDYENRVEYDSYRLIAKNLVETEDFPLIKSVNNTYEWDRAVIIDENGNVYDYDFCNSQENTSVILEGANIEKYQDFWMLANDGNVYHWDYIINADEFDGKSIKDIYEYRFVLAEDGTLYCGNNIIDVLDKTLVKTSSIYNAMVAIDNDGKLCVFIPEK